MMDRQCALMKFDPADGKPRPYPSHAEQWRMYHGYRTAWLFNPWTGKRRSPLDVGMDVQGRGVLPPNCDPDLQETAPIEGNTP